MSRDDISDYLVHWTKGDNYNEAYDRLCSIVMENTLRGGCEFIKGEFTCVCFTEAPQDKFHKILGRYKPFGIRVSKEWVYSQGGRPVIYQTDGEYNWLHDDMKWRHVRYEPGSTPAIDFTWEREWRLQTDELYLPPEEVVLILPSEDWANALISDHYALKEQNLEMEALAYGEWAAMQSPEPFHYSYSIIET